MSTIKSPQPQIILDEAAMAEIRGKLNFIRDGSERGAGRVVVGALNTVGRRGSTKINRELAKVLNLDKKGIGKGIRFGKATYSKKQSNVLTRARPLSLSRFPVKQTATGVDASVFRGGSPIQERSAFIAGSRVPRSPGRGRLGFIARVFSPNEGESTRGGLLVFRRKGKSRLPLDVLRADSLAETLEKKTQGSEPIAADMGEQLAKQIARGVNWENIKATRKARDTLL